MSMGKDSPPEIIAKILMADALEFILDLAEKERRVSPVGSYAAIAFRRIVDRARETLDMVGLGK